MLAAEKLDAHPLQGGSVTSRGDRRQRRLFVRLQFADGVHGACARRERTVLRSPQAAGVACGIDFLAISTISSKMAGS